MSEVILVHGLWHSSWSMLLLAQRLKQAGFACRSFNYATWHQDPVESISALADFCRQTQSEKMHLVGYSLGGLLILKMLEKESRSEPGQGMPLKAGRVVLLGSPLAGSSAARRLSSTVVGRMLLRHSRSGLVEGVNFIPSDRECAMIAGNRPYGLGRLMGAVKGSSDGTVAVIETTSDDLTDHLLLPFSHTGLMLSGSVASQVAAFFNDGSFNLHQ